ncbi:MULTISPECIES: DUF6541 family protein [unclassified Arthrobacter]|uniref:DUF6541 family protein n=1 Tax=unclassified Arthrobacter TaxID=235627 RepID=UPI0011B041DD|nr:MULTISPECIES: DUF6541 family protein [unclassified Arthrobacter]
MAHRLRPGGSYMDWLSAAPALMIALLILVIPGFAVGLVLRIRTFDAIALAPLITVTLISVSAIVASMIGLPWNVGVLAAATIAALLIAFLFRLAERRLRPEPLPRQGTPFSRELQYAGAALIAFLLIGWQVARVIGVPENFSQTFDNNFHLNAVRYVLETADASSLTLNSMTSGDQPATFYPAAWHGLTALVIQLSGAPLTVGVSAVSIAIAAAVWPLSLLFAVRQLTRLVPAAVLGAGVLAGSFAAFPLLLLDFGVLYPNLLSLAMVPAGLALGAIVLKQAPAAMLDAPRAWLLAALSLPGIAVSHPNGIMTLIALALPVLISAYVFRLRDLVISKASPVHYVLPTVLFAAAWGIIIVLWNLVRPAPEDAFWGNVQTVPRAVGEALLLGPLGAPAAWTASILVIVGIVACFRQPRLLWVAGSFAVAVALFAVSSGTPISDTRMFLTGVWYNDSQRLAAVLPLAAAPLAVLGLNLILKPLTAFTGTAIGRSRMSGTTAAATSAVFAVVPALMLFPLTQGNSMDTEIAKARVNYIPTDMASLLTNDELEMIDELDELTPEDAVIAVNPWTGGALAYALGDRETTHKHIFSTSTPELEIIDASLKDAGDTPGVCEAVEATGVGYVLDFGDQEVHGGDHPYPGLDDLETDDDFKLISSVGDVRLYEFVGC